MTPYEQGRQDFAREALEDLATRGFAIGLWQHHERIHIRMWLEGLRDGRRWSYHDRDRAADIAKANASAAPIHHSYEDGETE